LSGEREDLLFVVAALGVDLPRVEFGAGFVGGGNCIFQEFRNVEFMTKTISMNNRGMVTLPKPMRKRIGYGEGGGLLVAEERPEGILLRPGRVVAVENYSPERIAEFKASDAELAPFAPRLMAGVPLGSPQR
jgi:bifunctional DNA-binding transcriptional regulator/antitoxin component of YhaV-PrlF toxin-antitoxin module